MFSKNELRLHYLLNASISSVYSKQHSLKTSPHTKKHAKEVRDCFLRMFANKAVISQGIRPSKGTLLRRRWHGAEKPSELAVPAELADCSGTWWSAERILFGGCSIRSSPRPAAEQGFPWHHSG